MLTSDRDWDHLQTPAEARRWQLLAAGRRLILAHGIERATVDAIAREAGVAKGSFYTYFDSRTTFLDALRVALVEDIGNACQRAAAGPWEGLLRRVMDSVVAWETQHAPLLGLFVGSYMADPDRPTRRPLLRLVQDLLEAGAAAGVLRSLDCEPAPTVFDQTAPFVVEVLRDACNRARQNPLDAAALDAADEFLLRALRFDPGAARTATYG